MNSTKAIAAVLLAGVSALATGQAAFAGKAASNNTSAAQPQPDTATQSRIQNLEEQVDTLSGQIADLKRSTGDQYTDIQNQRGQDVQVSLKNGRPTFKTADGDFSLSLRALVQFDNAYYSEGHTPAGTDFASGSNFRRARFGLNATLFKDWTAEFIYDFGASGIEASTISSAFIQYDGLDPVHIKIGAYAPPEDFDDSTSASDLLFLERAQPSDLSRSIAGADGRDAATIFAYDDNYFAAASYTGGVVGEAANFDEQQAVVGRLAYRLLKSSDYNFVVGGDVSYILKVADSVATPGASNPFRLRERPELNVDNQSIRLVDTGNIDTDTALQWSLEAAGNWKNLYAQGGYYGFQINRRASVLPDPNFNGWYAQASWVLTGESKAYTPSRGAFAAPVPAERFTLDGTGWGAWELAARYSVLNLNYNAGIAGSATPTGGIRGGEQKIWTAGINWYPNPAIRFVLDFQHTDVSRLNGAGAGIGADLDAISLRTQLSL